MRTICLAEDNADNRLLAQTILEERYTVIEFEDGIALLEWLSSPAARPDAILLDISLPGMDGTEVLARLRADPARRDLPVIAFTAHAMAGDRARLLDAGFDDYVTKPITDEALLFAAIERAVPVE